MGTIVTMSDLNYFCTEKEDSVIKSLQNHISTTQELFSLLQRYAGSVNYGIHGRKVTQINNVLYSIDIEILTLKKFLHYLHGQPFQLFSQKTKDRVVEKIMSFTINPCSEQELARLYNQLLIVFRRYQQFPQSVNTQKIENLLKNIRGK